MGCDIHGVVQTRWKDGAAWRTRAMIDRDRNYLLFSALAGVRGYDDSAPISEPRGLPNDFKPGKRMDEHVLELEGSTVNIWMGDHSHSWLTLDEIEQWPGWDQNDLRARVGEQWWAWLRWIRLKYGELADVRLVFGFDN